MNFLSKFFGSKKNKEPGGLPKAALPVQPQPTSPQVRGAGYAPGDLIANRYEVVKTLVGGMGVVYLCLNRQEDFPVALKTFKPGYLPNRAACDRFLREGDIWVGLAVQPYIVRARGVEYLGDRREVYLVWEWVAEAEGKRDASLRAWLGPGRSLPIEQALLFALRIAWGTKYVTTGITNPVHHNRKLLNRPVEDGKNARVTDFNLVKTLIGLDDTGVVLRAERQGQV